MADEPQRGFQGAGGTPGGIGEFVIGLVGRQLHPLSHLVQAMRKTTQTSQYLQTLGPFFVGHVLWQSPFAG